MKSIEKPWIKLKENIDQEDYDLINTLQEKCIAEDGSALKLELDYKMGAAAEHISALQHVNEFMYFDGEELVGYIGISSFGGAGATIEVNGMVHPDYRRQGIFTRLSELVMAEWKRRKSASMLLLSDRQSGGGQKFIAGSDATYKHSEYEMYLNENSAAAAKPPLHGILLRKATNGDALEIARQNSIYFNQELSTEEMTMPEEEEKRGMTIYLAELEQQIIGKVHLQLTSDLGAIYGLGVLPEYRGKGYGRAILLMAIERLQEAKAEAIMLQVEAENANALNLYKSCGFKETSTMDYYEIRA
jgi:ribosomal protein S18 acetylase RimI-like enzyme